MLGLGDEPILGRWRMGEVVIRHFSGNTISNIRELEKSIIEGKCCKQRKYFRHWIVTTDSATQDGAATFGRNEKTTRRDKIAILKYIGDCIFGISD
jgi:hypothetical protein